MKKFVLLSLCAALFSNVAVADYYKIKVNNCDEASMRRALDKAAAENRAVVTVIECDEDTTEVVSQTTQTVSYAPYVANTHNTCNRAPIESVVKREYFVRETVQQYEPVVVYVPSNTYTRVRKTCNNGCEF